MGWDGWDNGNSDGGNGDGSALDRIFRKVHGINDKDKQAGFWRTHNARERGRQTRVKAQKDKKK